MAMIPEHIIDEVKNATDIVALIEQHIELKRAGSAYKGLCPFHDDTNPSMHVSPQRQSFKCFVCGAGGSAFTFLQRFRNITFPEAVRELARDKGIEVPTTGPEVPRMPQGRLEALRDALRLAQRFFVHSLGTPAGEEARRYLARRGYDEAACERYGLGYAPASFDGLLTAARKRGIRAEVLAEAGLAKPRQRGSGFYDTFRNRVIFPVRDRMGRVCTFGARALSDEDQPKYLNGPETPVFKKSSTLFGMDISREGLRRHGHALVMEGYTDVLAAHLAGFDCAVAGMGTAFTEQQATMLSRATQSVVLMYDGDAAGQTAAERTIDLLLPTGVEVRVAPLPEGQDVDDVLREDGAEAFGARIEGALPFLEFKLARLGERYDLASTHGRARASEEVVATIAKVKSRMEQSQLLSLLSQPDRLGVDLVGAGGEELLRRALGQAQEQDRRRARGRQQRTAPQARREAPRKRSRGEGLVLINRRLRNNERRATPGRTRDELRWLHAALTLPGLRDELFRHVGPDDFRDEARSRLWDRLAARHDEGAPLDLAAVQLAYAAEPEVQQILAALLDEAELEELVGRQLQYLRRRREASRQIDDLRERGILPDRPAAPPAGESAPAQETTVPPMLGEGPKSAETDRFRASAEDAYPDVVWEIEDTSSLDLDPEWPEDAAPKAHPRTANETVSNPPTSNSPASSKEAASSPRRTETRSESAE